MAWASPPIPPGSAPRSVMLRHADVHDDEIRLQRLDQREELGRVACLPDDLETGSLQQAGQALPEKDVVVGERHPHGLLSGTMGSGTTFPADDWRSQSSDFTGERFRRNLDAVDQLEDFARTRAISLPQLALSWTLSNPAVQVAIVGTRHPAHLDESAAAADVTLSDEYRREIDRILAGVLPVVGPSPEGV